jgi:hypothetical protein
MGEAPATFLRRRFDRGGIGNTVSRAPPNVQETLVSTENDPRPEDGAPPGKDREPGVPPHQPSPEDSQKDEVQEEDEESFPSSDPPSTGGPGV